MPLPLAMPISKVRSECRPWTDRSGVFGSDRPSHQAAAISAGSISPSDQADLSTPVNGYYLQFGESGSNDAIELFEQSGGTSISIARGTDGAIASSFDVGVRVTRDNSGLWSLFVDAGGGTNYVFENSGVNTTHTSSAHLGVFCSFTISNASNFYFDDFYAGPMVVDMDPPQITTVEIIDDDEITVVFDEAVEQSSSAETTNNYDIQPFLSATSATQQSGDATRVDLVLTASMANGSSYNLIVTGVEDLAGNAMPSTSFMYTYVVPDVADPRDVVINELMADPSPVVALPDAEFIELFNASGTKNFDLLNWTIDDGSSTATLPAFTLLPDSFVIITDAGNVGLFSAFPNVVGVSSFPSLNNTGDALSLRDDAGNLVDEVDYSSAWYNDAVKDDGGWTLEQINPFTPCSGQDNWSASNDLRGGTPAAVNSILDVSPDIDPPSLLSVSVNSATSLTAQFDEALDAASVIASAFNIGPSLTIGTVSLSTSTQVNINLIDPIQSGVVYSLTAPGLTDCAGNLATTTERLFGLPEAVQVGDVVINEVLYDPLSGGSDYVELYNRGSRILDVSQLNLANVDEGLIDNITPITTNSIVLLPEHYLLITEDAVYVQGEYPNAVTGSFIETAMPSYNNGEGSVVLLDNLQNVLDRFDYDDDLHFDLLVDIEGVSLERIDPARDSNDPSNWHSAAETENFGTPGYENSQYAIGVSNGEMNIEPAIFSPDNDGYQDVLTITYAFGQQGTVGTLRIHDLAGRPIRTLYDNELLANEGAVSWDGIQDNGEKARIGPYIVLLEVFGLSGDTEVFKQTITLAHPLD